MSGRGMRGRGRGRGGGRGGGPVIAPPVDDDGALVELDQGPPPLFPEINNLPHPPKLEQKDDRLILRWAAFERWAEESDFNLGRNDELSKEKRDALMAVIHNDPYYLPAELLGKKAPVMSKAGAAATAAKRARKGAGEGATGNLDALFHNASAMEKEEEKGEGKKEKPGEEGRGEEVEEEVEEEEELDEDDDYLQGDYFDDDEDYGDPDDDGGDEAYY